MNHEMRNAARKLTPAERKDKKRSKILEDTSKASVVALFRIRDMTTGATGLRFSTRLKSHGAYRQRSHCMVVSRGPQTHTLAAID